MVTGLIRIGNVTVMAATFSDVLQLHWGDAIKPDDGTYPNWWRNGNQITSFSPWSSATLENRWFANYPPPAIVPRGNTFQVHSDRNCSCWVKSSHNWPFEGKNTRSTEMTPIVDFALSDAVTPSEVRYLNIDLTCADDAPSVPLQLFWLEDGHPYFDEEHSARFIVPHWAEFD